MPHLNIEIKARCKDSGRIRDYLSLRKAKFVGTDRQTDTYFKATAGRLKLREGNIENHLIHYDRENIAGPKQSHVTLYKSTPGSQLKAILEKAIGVWVVIDKQRDIYYIDNVKFHIDKVAQLGNFVEIEAIDRQGSIGEEALRRQCEFYIKEFGILNNDLIIHSYSDLLLAK